MADWGAGVGGKDPTQSPTKQKENKRLVGVGKVVTGSVGKKCCLSRV